jgi:peptidylprolyl isomerase
MIKLISKKTGSAVDITIPEEIYRADGLAIIKHFTQMDLFKFVPALTKVNFVESYENKQKPKKEMITPESENKVEIKSKK